MKETFYRFDVPKKICLIADTHEMPFDKILSSVQRNKPDIIAIAGDILNSSRISSQQPRMLLSVSANELLKSCAQLAPTFFSMGNHEWMLSQQDKQIISDLGVTMLDNSWVRTEGMVIGGQTPSVATAYDKFRKGKSETYPTWRLFNAPHKIEPDISWLDEFEQQDGFKLLLCHHPEYYPQYLAGRKIDLILSGHAHGGQIRIFGRGLFAPGQGIFPKYTSGIHSNMIISRGLSNTAGMIPRLFNRREIIYIVNEK